ncbi:MAG: YerC/YecD family TrpR-related protein [Clostridia bacterium]|nr:YerC/YecD family TrpR-related protein [Clostridia bacterium]
MSDKINDPYINVFYDAILSLKTRKECEKFFDDICTIAEIKSLVQRMQVAVLLNEGKTYSEITGEANVSTATISRVNRCLEYGSDGYKTVLSRISTNINDDEVEK